MQISILIAVLSVVGLAYCVPVRNGMIFYQTPSFYNQPQQRYPYHQAMFVQYSQPPQYPSYRSYQGTPPQANGVSAFASGDTIAAGTYLKEHQESPAVESHPAHEEIAISDNGVHAIAEAYPEEPHQVTGFEVNDEPQLLVDQSNEVVPPQNEQVWHSEVPDVANQRIPQDIAPVVEEQTGAVDVVTTEEAPRTTTIVPVIVPARKKKVRVELAPVPEVKKTVQEDDEEYEEDDVPFFAKPQKRKNAGQSPYSFFPLHFGNTSGGAIAVANSFSTSKGGASSHAIAYGSPPSKQKAYKRIVQQ